MNVRLVDEHIGRRIRRRRRLLGMTLTALGQACGATFQQIQKYEAGQNSMYATRLWRIAGALDVPVPYFFEGLCRDPACVAALPSNRSPAETLELVAAFQSLSQPERRRLLTLTMVLASDPPDRGVPRSH